jgi:hypothetical protein
MNHRQKVPAFLTTLSIVLIGACLLSSCKSVLAWAEGQDPATTPPVDPGAAGGSSMPTIGGADPLDLLVTVLTVLGLVPAARMVGLARPWLASLIVSIWGKKKPTETPVPPAP